MMDSRQLEEQLVQQLALQLVELQTQLTFQEDLIQSLNDTVVRQDRELYLLNQKLQALNGQLNDVSSSLADMKADQPPPHY